MKVTLRHAIAFALALLWLFPLYLVVINASTAAGEYAEKEFWELPGSFSLIQNVVTAWQTADLGSSVISTLLYATVGGGAAVLIAAAAAFAIVALRVRYGFACFMFLYGGTVVPFQMFLAPLFDSYSKVGLYDTRIGLILVYTAVAVPFAVFVLRNHFSGIPHELLEAARIDGASSFVVFSRIYLPLSTNALAAVFVFQFTFIWNDLLFGITLARSAEIRPIMASLSVLQGQYTSTSLPAVLAGALVVSIPTFVLFLALQKLFVQALAGIGK